MNFKTFTTQGFPLHFMQPQLQLPQAEGKRGNPKDKTYYTMLELQPTCSMKDIRTSFRKLSVERHPDKGGNHEEYTNLSKAYAILNDEETRMCYDAFGENFMQVPNIQIWKQNLKHADITIVKDLSLEYCLRGTQIRVLYDRLSENGIHEESQHSFFASPGTTNKQKFIFSGIGHRESSKIPGDLVVIIKEIEREDFKRVENIIIHRKKITLAESLSGQLKIIHPNTREFFITNPNGFNSGAWYKINNRGGTEDSPMFIQTSLDVPTLTQEQKKRMLEVLNYTPEKCSSRLEAQQISENLINEEIKVAVDSKDPTENNVQQCPVQ